MYKLHEVIQLDKVASMLDHTNINLNATEKEIIETCEQAKKYNMRGVCVRGNHTSIVAKELAGTEIKTITLIDPPIGTSPIVERVKISKEAIVAGTKELDIVMNLDDLKNERYEKIVAELKKITSLAPTKVIIVAGCLNDAEVAKASQLVKAAGAICVKTSTEKTPFTRDDLKKRSNQLKIMRKNAPGLLIKASGSVKILEDALMMIDAGADIIGTSTGHLIVEGSDVITACDE
jgi:deoxyribose-phosphate aldolase